MHPAVKAECSRQFLSRSPCNNKPYIGPGRHSQVRWITGWWQRLRYFPAFFWEGGGRQMCNVERKLREMKRSKLEGQE